MTIRRNVITLWRVATMLRMQPMAGIRTALDNLPG
jgi:hypothetical protein